MRVHEQRSLDGIAIIGLAGRFPGAPNLDAFWANLVNGVESVSAFSEAELAAAGVDPFLLRDPTYVRARALLADADLFDAAFFGYTPADAASMDPQQRVFLECAWEALERAGHDPERYAGAIGLFAGHGLNSYLLANLCAGREWIDEFLAGAHPNSFQTFLGNDKDYLTTRVAYKLNLRGPAVTVQTACSTSLVALCMACQSLLTYQSDMALAGGVSITFPEKKGYLYREGGITSPDGHCRAFSADAQGTVFGSGAGVVVLKRVADAIADGDSIYAVIRGSALNNDGSLKISYTAPSVDGQAEAILLAQTLAGVAPETISYVEAHGTGTLLGDPVEVAALTQAFRAGTDQRQFCALGSVKTNIGHLDAAAGIAGLIKTTLALHRQKIPPSLNYARANPQIDFASSPFFVAATLADWPTVTGVPRRAGVSSFGVGGTNAHLVLEEAPAPARTAHPRAAQLLLLSARSESALAQAALNLRDHLLAHPTLNLADVAYTLQVGRRAFGCRRAVLCRDHADALALLAPRSDRAQTVERSAPDLNSSELTTLGAEWLAGGEPDWTTLHADARQRVPLPTYPFERKRFFVEPPGRSGVVPPSSTPEPQRETVAPAYALLPRDRIAAELLVLFRDLSGLELDEKHRPIPLIELGFDSLFLTQVRQSFETQFGVNITYRQLAESLNTIDALADHLATHAPDQVGTGGPPVRSPAVTFPAPGPAGCASPLSTALGPFRPLSPTSAAPLTVSQQAWLTAFTARFTARTANSKRIAAVNRAGVADPRSLANYRHLWKELVYQIVVDTSAGAHLRDIDGNDYLDVTMGFGANLFGHSPAFVTEALTEQLTRGVHIGPQSPLTGEVAALIREFTGMERVTFCNTGSEAVLAAVRIARTVTQRATIVYFSGDYHGLFDEVLQRPHAVGGQPGAAPIAPGIPPSAGANVIVLDYGTPATLETIRRLGTTIAAVLVEPVQSRHPELQPREFLHALREITHASGTILIFDEVITGFRIHPGGAQAWFGVQADLATYGKVIGGGLPMGALAGSARCMDALDGGAWNFGDDSAPEADLTFFAGTFVRHPLALAAARASLLHLKAGGPDLQTALNRRTTALADSLNAFFAAAALPLRIHHFGSLFRFHFPAELPHATLLVFALLERGIYVRDAHQNCFLSTAHTDDDVARFVAAVQAGVAELQQAGFLPSAEPTAAPFALTDAQQEIWLACQIGSDLSRAYNQSLTLDLRGPLEVGALQAAWIDLVNRHEALRLCLAADGSSQQLAAEPPVPLVLHDWSALTTADRASRSDGIAAAEAEQSFDLVRGPLVRARVCRLTPEHHRFVFTAHHLICDGSSVGVLFRELGQLYQAQKSGAVIALPPAKSFHTYAAGAAARHATPAFAAAEAYWVSQFATTPAPLELPLDHPRTAATGNRGGNERLSLPPPLQEALKHLGAQHGATLFATLLAAFKVLLQRLSGQAETVVGVFTSGRAQAGPQPLVGHCVNLLPIRSAPVDDTAFPSFLAEISGRVLDARDHEDHAYGRLVRRLNLPRTPGRPPLIGALFNLEPDDAGALAFANLESSVDLNAKGFVNFELFLNIREGATGLTLDLAFNAGLFDATTIRRWLSHYHTLLDSIVAQPAMSLGTLPLLTASERQDLTTRWNATAQEFPRNAVLHELFEAQALLHADRTAVTAGTAHLSYRELNARAGRLAARLRDRGVGPEVRVALCLDRSFDLVVAILATLKAGGAYVPLDPAYPAERLAFMLRDSGAAVLLTHAALRALFASPPAHLICLDEAEPVVPPSSVLRSTHSPSATATSLAYVIYTSGSTGQPKGVMIEHRAIVNHLTWRQRTFPLQPGDSFLQKASASFDISVWEIFAPLLAGARLVFARLGGQGDPVYLAHLIATEQITDVHFNPAMLQLTLETPGFAAIAALRRVFCGGEPLPAALQAQFHAGCRASLISQYGPTETTVDATWFVCDPAAATTTAPIGRPIANTQAYLLDRHLQPVPLGVTGELCLAGESLARGYHHAPGLTAEKFVRLPFSEDPTARIYRTGDRCRQRVDGAIEFLGRIDAQVKIRGFRIEPREIEFILATHPEVRDAIVVARPDASGEPQLVACVVPTPPPVAVSDRSGHPRDLAATLRAFLSTKLPAYLVPDRIGFLTELPRLPNGKVDRRALDPSRQESPVSAPAFTAPATATEIILARIWCEVLPLRTVSTTANFFALGGHSLLAVRVVARVRAAFQIELPLTCVFALPTLAALATQIEDQLLARVEALSDTAMISADT